MDITNKIGNLIVESGIRNITDLKKKFKKAKIYFHLDLDGVTSAIAMKSYLEGNGIKVIDAETIQYGGSEYAVTGAKDDVLKVLVDFAHGKPMMHIHTDHHEGQVGVETGTSTAFVKAPSNAENISSIVSPSPIFPQKDIDVISMVDTADFAKHGLHPDDVMRATFSVDPKVDVKKNLQMMGLVVNKLTLAYKNKKGFLSKLVLQAKPSLMSMYNIIVKMAKEEGFKTPEEINMGSDIYMKQRKDKSLGEGKPNDIPNMKNGESILIGTTIFQKGGGYMGGKNVYDRYAVFSVHPDADFLITQWPMGLVQVSGNPFSKRKNPYHLGDIVIKKVLNKFSSELKREQISIDRIKYELERDIGKKEIKGAVGFKWSDVMALFSGKLNGLQSKTDWWPNMVADITNKPYNRLSPKQKGILKKVTISAWDLIMSGSGGHKNITNVSQLNFLPDTKDFMNKFCIEIAKEMANKRLE